MQCKSKLYGGLEYEPACSNNVLARVKEAFLAGVTRDFVIADSPLGFRRPIHVNDSDVRGESLEGTTVSLDQNIPNEECVVKGRELGRSTAHKDLTHSRSQMGDAGCIFLHPFGQLFILNIFPGRHEELCT